MHVLFPPWNKPTTWTEACRTVAFLLDRYKTRLDTVLVYSCEIKENLAKLSPLTELLCQNTCPWCPDPCCLSAIVWFDFADLLFLHLTGETVPSSQPQPNQTKICRFFGPKGCNLPRAVRPWVCTWYTCASQWAFLRLQDQDFQETYKRGVQEIRHSRRKMETEFIRLVTKG